MKKAIAISPEPCVLSDDEVPEGWRIVTIQDVCEVNPPRPPKDFLPADAPVTFVPMPAVDAELGVITNPDIKPYLEVRNGFTSFRDGDVIMAKITPCMENGKAAIVHGMKNGIGFGSTEFHVMRSRGEILPEYLYYYIRQKSYRKEAEAHFTGSVGQKRVPADFIKQSIIPLPPLSEQQHIVARVETLLAHVDAARDRLSRVPLIMKKFRQAVLAAACSGRLTEEWRETNTIEGTGFDLLQKIIEAKQKNRSKNLKNYRDANQIETEHLTEIPEEWTWATLERITQNFDGQRIPIKSDDRKIRRGAYPYYGASGIIDTIDDFLFDGEFLLIGEDGANLVMRSTPIAFQAKGKFWVNNHAHILQTNGGIPLQFIEHYINSIDLQQYVTGSAQPKLTQANMNIIPVPLPPLVEQHEIVRRVGMLFERADAFDQEVVAASRRCERLTQAVLGKAFRGELINFIIKDRKSRGDGK